MCHGLSAAGIGPGAARCEHHALDIQLQAQCYGHQTAGITFWAACYGQHAMGCTIWTPHCGHRTLGIAVPEGIAHPRGRSRPLHTMCRSPRAPSRHGWGTPALTAGRCHPRCCSDQTRSAVGAGVPSLPHPAVRWLRPGTGQPWDPHPAHRASRLFECGSSARTQIPCTADLCMKIAVCLGAAVSGHRILLFAVGWRSAMQCLIALEYQAALHKTSGSFFLSG